MVILILVWATCGIATAAAKNAAPAAADVTPVAAARDWTDASGKRHARAALLRIEGDTLWLRRPDGKLSKAAFAQLSEPDRQYVAERRAELATTSKVDSKPNLPASPVTAIVGQLDSLRKLPGWSQLSQPISPHRVVPAALVYLRVSRDFLEDYAERTVRQQKPVHDYILGTRIVGESNTRGRTRLVLLPSYGHLSGKLMFEGTVHTQTRGYNGPVVLHQTSDTNFRASKLITFDESGLRVAPAITDAPTNLETTSIDTCLPRLRGRIARRIAWSRVSGKHQQAEAITAEHTARTVSSDFDERTDKSVAKVQNIFKTKVPGLESNGDPLQAELRFRSNIDSVEMAMVRQVANAEERKLRPPVVEGNPDVAVRVHRTLLTRALADPQVRQDLTPLFVKLLKARFDQNEDSGQDADKNLADDTTKFSIDLDWLAFDYQDSVH